MPKEKERNEVRPARPPQQRRTYLLYPPVDANFVPLVVVETDFVGFNLHFLFPVR